MTMTDINFAINRDNILSMTTIQNDRIRLPYAVNKDVLFWAEALIAEKGNGNSELDFCADCMRVLETSKITAVVTLSPSQRNPRAGIDISVDTADGQHLHTHLYIPSAKALAAEIITEFLEGGAPGLRNDVQIVYEKFHSCFLSDVSA